MILLDTCVLSEVARPRPDAHVLRWFDAAPGTDLYVSVLTLGEIANGCARLADGARRRRLETWLVGLKRDFGSRVLPIDTDIAEPWGRLAAAAQKRGRTLGTVDGLIAATALRHGLAVATRNVGDFATTGVDVINPWTD